MTQATGNAGSVPPAGRKYFSVDEAKRALPYVKRVVADLLAKMDERAALVERVRDAKSASAREALEPEYDRLMDAIEKLVEEIQEVGVDVKDLRLGLVDFPHWHNGREVCLCWKHGEGELGAWHETNAGFAGRKPIDGLEKAP
jgi:hypothetical protein